jgi:hypothetical protein
VSERKKNGLVHIAPNTACNTLARSMIIVARTTTTRTIWTAVSQLASIKLLHSASWSKGKIPLCGGRTNCLAVLKLIDDIVIMMVMMTKFSIGQNDYATRDLFPLLSSWIVEPLLGCLLVPVPSSSKMDTEITKLDGCSCRFECYSTRSLFNSTKWERSVKRGLSRRGVLRLSRGPSCY